MVPHTATEEHQMWDLAGTYGQTPWSARARLRWLDDARQATDWSPVASIAG